MALFPGTMMDLKFRNTMGILTAVWSGSGPAHNPVARPDIEWRSVQVTGALGGAIVVFEGSNDGEHFVTLTDRRGNALSFAAAGLRSLGDEAAYLRPRVSVDRSSPGAEFSVVLYGRRRGSG